MTRADLDWARGQGQVLVQEIERPDFLTQARIERAVRITGRRDETRGERYVAQFGEALCQTEVIGSYKVPLYARAGEPYVFQPLGRAAPPAFRYRTHAFWLALDARAVAGVPAEERAAGLYSYAGAPRLATAVEELCDPSDVDAVGLELHPDTGMPTIIVFDTSPGGIGISEAAFTQLDRVLRRARQILADCPYCSRHPESRGCPYCVTAQYGDETTINRRVALALADIVGA